MQVPGEFFNFLHDWLNEAKRQFDTGNDAGRAGVEHALESVLLFLIALQPVLQTQDGLLTPLGRLLDALRALDNSNVLPVLKPKPRRGPPPADDGYNALKGLAVFTVARLIATDMRALEARMAVANTLRKAGVEPLRKGSAGGSGELTERTIRGWQEEVAADVGVRTIAARECVGLESEILQVFLGSTPTQAQRLLWYNQLPSMWKKNPEKLKSLRLLQSRFDEIVKAQSANWVRDLRRRYLAYLADRATSVFGKKPPDPLI